MTTPPSFPTLAGQGWSVHKKPMFSTIVASHVSGREVRDALYQNPIWEFELTFDGLDSASSYPGLGANSLQALMGLFLSCRGSSATFLYTDPTDNGVTAGGIATGDGATTTFTFGRFLGSFFEPVGWVTSVANVYLNGVNQASGWSLTTPNSLVFVDPAGRHRRDHGHLRLCLPVPLRRRRPRFRAVHAKPVVGEERQVPLGQSILDEVDHDRRHQPDQRRDRLERRADRLRRMLPVHLDRRHDLHLDERRLPGRLQRPDLPGDRPAGQRAQIQGRRRPRGRQAATDDRRPADRHDQRRALPDCAARRRLRRRG